MGRTKKKLKWIRAKAEPVIAWVKAHRDIERDELEAARAEDRAWLKERENLIMANPLLRKMYELLLRKLSMDDTRSAR